MEKDNVEIASFSYTDNGSEGTPSEVEEVDMARCNFSNSDTNELDLFFLE